jgi:multidrug efflux pump subunit AcrB
LIDRITKNISKVEKHHMTPSREDYLDALVSASKSRLQPIIVTTLTTLF